MEGRAAVCSDFLRASLSGPSGRHQPFETNLCTFSFFQERYCLQWRPAVKVHLLSNARVTVSVSAPVSRRSERTGTVKRLGWPRFSPVAPKPLALACKQKLMTLRAAGPRSGEDGNFIEPMKGSNVSVGFGAERVGSLCQMWVWWEIGVILSLKLVAQH